MLLRLDRLEFTVSPAVTTGSFCFSSASSSSLASLPSSYTRRNPLNFCTLPVAGTDKPPVLALGLDIDGRLIEHRRSHLRRHKPHPDQPIQLQQILIEKRRKTLRRPDRRRRTNRFVRILRVFLTFINVRLFRPVIRSVASRSWPALHPAHRPKRASNPYAYS